MNNEINGRMVAATMVFLGFVWGGGYALNELYKEWMFYPALITCIIVLVSYLSYMGAPHRNK